MRLIRNTMAVLPVLLLMANTSSPLIGKTITDKPFSIAKPAVTPAADYYAAWNLNAAGISQEAFSEAMKGYTYLQEKKLLNNTNVLTIVDYSKPSSQKRLFVLDMTEGKILFNTLVAHGRNSGLEYATNFSNAEESHKTSLGFFITMNTYTGNNGYSLKLQGCEKGINDKALERAIVVHGAEYADENFLHNNGYLGRSYGCPAVPEKLSKKIIDTIKNGSCMFLYHPTKKYSTASKILNS
ncbi:murein L,D-transpeptidase catalytic domain family protein [Ferruginibacter sp. SUN106]|uniref:murein L,D-transpeptidase catalytic domain family protein n=1 Tax=Ferruginibacter sp. SUN106 TaxID=2978348 RepID=UPI003D36BEB5